MININFLSWNRIDYIKYNVYELLKLSSKYKQMMRLTFHHSDNPEILEYIKVLSNNGFVCDQMLYHAGFNYTDKIKKCIEIDCEFSISCDEDCLCPVYTWRHLIDSTKYLTNDVAHISPNISNGIPSVDYFISSNFPDKVEEYNNLFKSVNFGNIWGVDYSSLNGYTDINDFYNRVKNLPHYYKGIHPIRLCREAQIKLCQDILDNQKMITSEKKLVLGKCDRPYLCNTMFLIRTSDWKEAFLNFSRDPYDEVSINIFREHYGKSYYILKNSNVIHPYYNIFDDSMELSNQFYKKFVDSIGGFN